MEKRRILIVDDDSKLSHLVQVILNRTGNYLTAVENRPHQVLANARHFRPDLVLLDVDMPGKDGGDIAAEMEADPALKHIAIIFFTALVSRHEAEMQRKEGRKVRFLAKTADPKILCAAINDALAATV